MRTAYDGRDRGLCPRGRPREHRGAGIVAPPTGPGRIPARGAPADIRDILTLRGAELMKTIRSGAERSSQAAAGRASAFLMST